MAGAESVGGPVRPAVPGRAFARRWDSEACLIAARSRDELIRRAERVRELVAADPSIELADVASALSSQLAGNDVRLGVVAASTEDLARKLAHAEEKLRAPDCRRIKDRSGIFFFAEPLARSGSTAFIFPGEGSQYPGMLADLCLHFEEVRTCFDLADRAFVGHPRGYLPSDLLFPRPGLGGASDGDPRLWQMDGAVEAVFSANLALYRLLGELEIRPGAVVGHSTGEYSALIASNCVTIESDVHLISLMQKLNGMYESLASDRRIPEAVLLAVGAGRREAVVDAVERAGEGRLFVAMDNCPHQIVLCGRQDDIDAVEQELRRTGAVCERLRFDRAYHTPLFEEVCGPLEEFFASLPIAEPKVPLYSCATAALLPADPVTIRALGARQWALPVRFRETVETMYSDGVRVFIEVGPRGNLSSFVADTLRDRPHVAVAADLRSRSGTLQLNHLVALLAAHGVELDAGRLYRGRVRSKIDLEATGAPEVAKKRVVSSLRSSLPPLYLDDETSARLRRSVKPSEREEFQDRQPADAEVLLPGPAAAIVSSDSPPSSARRARLMQEYLRTTERLVESQRRIMLAYLGRSDGSDMSRTATILARSHDAADHPGVLPAAGSGGSASPVQIIARDVVAVTVPVAGGGSSDDRTQSTPGQAAPTADVARLFLEIVAERTGYPIDMLDPSLSLEADLGIDSIKRVEILGSLQQVTGDLPQDFVEIAASLRTLAEIVELLLELRAATAAAGAGEAPAGARPAPGTPATGEDLPLLGTVVRFEPHTRLITRFPMSLEAHPYLRDHTLGCLVSEADPQLTALPLMMLTMAVEFMAQAARRLDPDRVVVAVRDVLANRWIALSDDQAVLQVTATRQPGDPDEIRVEMREVGSAPGAGSPNSEAEGTLLVQATVILGARYPDAPGGAPSLLAESRPSRWRPDELYTKVMFHGPRLRGVASVDRWAPGGAETTLRALSNAGFFSDARDVPLLTDPALLDAAGQVVGFWTAEHLDSGFVVFPFRIRELSFFGPAVTSGTEMTCRARIALSGDSYIRSDFDVLHADGSPHIRVTGWEDKRIPISEEFFRFRFSPRDVVLSRRLETAASHQKGEVACRLEFGDRLMETEGRVWREGLAHLVLSRAERTQWRTLDGSEDERTRWLLERGAAKDAVRIHVSERFGMRLCPADIETAQKEPGKLVMSGGWQGDSAQPLTVKTEFTDGGATAVLVPLEGDGWRTGPLGNEEVGRS